jgi:AcrR family transcriptional regulator
MLLAVTLALDVTIRNMQRIRPKSYAKSKAYHHGNLGAAAVAVGFELVEERGLVGFTLGEVGKRIGVSHTALYRHYADKDALLAALAVESFRSFEARLRDVGTSTGIDRLNEMVLAYLSFAEKHWAQYELMFSALIEHDKYPEIEQAGDRAFAALSEALTDPNLRIPTDRVHVTALHVWAHCHGLSALKAGHALAVNARELGQLALDGVAALVAHAATPG